ncbi:MAG: type II secretion system protein [Candidatus Sungbacteria bacterium]|uniref:Type II secretion system protein n=1 Tax=Candidatus Sungiibacteriota bacterium TaxID=2750080 RepID=A0A932YXV5_9BACT|nr:type II secretion system protein [Candidatus Sungbacteria bacterium]
MAKKNSRTGFTLLETIVALSVILGGLAGPFALATRGIFTAKFAKSKLVALYLAEEGVETIRHMRENNILGNFDWRGLGSCTGSCTVLQDGSYQVSVVDGSPSCPTIFATVGQGDPIVFDSASGLYLQSRSGFACPGVATSPSFTRVVTLSTPATDQMRVVSTITWSDSGILRQVRLEEVFYNWQ